MARTQTVTTVLRSILRPDFRNLSPLFSKNGCYCLIFAQKSFTILEVVPQQSRYQIFSSQAITRVPEWIENFILRTIPVEIYRVKDILTHCLLSAWQLTRMDGITSSLLQKLRFVTWVGDIAVLSSARTRELKKEYLHAEFKNALLYSQKHMQEWKSLMRHG